MGSASNVSTGSSASADVLHYATRTVVFADVVESVRLMQRDEFAAAGRIRDQLLEAANETIPRHRGHLLQRLGDGLMIAFAHPRDATECASALHRRAAELAESVALGDRVLLRIGIHAADILTDDVAFYGNGVNVAARLAALAGPGETVISDSVRDQLATTPGGDLVDLGLCHLKHVEAPLQAYRLGPGKALPPQIESQIALRPTLAVIPLTLQSGGSAYLAVGEIIADEVIVALSRAPELRIVSRLSTTAFRGRKTQLKAIRALLGATYVLWGAYRVSGDTLIVTVELVDARNGEIVWAHGFKGKLAGLLAQDDDLVTSIVAGVASALMNTELLRTKSRALPTLDAYTLLLGGIGLMHRSDPRDFGKSRQAFEQLVERYPRYAAPYAYLAEWHVFKVTQGWFTNLEQEAAAALDWINRALDVDTADSLELMVNGLVHTNLLHRHDVAKVSYDQALEKNANEGLARLHRGTLWAFQGRGREAVEETDRAVELSPLDPWRYYYDSLRATAALAARDYERAIELARRSLRSNRSHASTLRVIAIASSELGRYDEAHESLAELRKLDPSLTVSGYLARSPAASYETGRTWSQALRRAGLPA
jgi:class 3 adenylate cyclase/TolB-like protein/tetratricopeptide (TPR) repeat protein